MSVVLQEGEVRVESLRRSKEEYMKDRLIERGYSELWADFTVSYQADEDLQKLWNRTVQILKRRFQSISITEETFAQVSVGRIQLSVEMIPWQEASQSLQEIFVYLTKGRQIGDIAFVRFNRPDFYLSEGYGLINGKISSKKHMSRLGYRSKKEFYGILDLPTLLAEVSLRNAIWQYATDHLDFVRRGYVRQLVEERNKSKFQYRFTANESKWERILQEMESISPGITGQDNLLLKEVSISQYVKSPVWSWMIGETESWKEVDLSGDRYLRNLVFSAALKPFLQDMFRLQEDASAREESFASHARVWQLKKNIPLKHQKRMKNNAFLSVYGSVELDADVDLSKFAEIEREFRRMRKIIPIQMDERHSFRIRKLGNYRAIGLYFPYHKALCVDLDGISSFAHELAHQLDYTWLGNGEQLSEQFDFVNVYDRYETGVLQALELLPKDDPFLEKWYGKTKYNRNYYLRPTEVFARSFELYLSEEKGIQSSFLQNSYNGPVYPKDRAYLDAVVAYFDKLLPPVAEEVEESSVVTAPSDWPPVTLTWDETNQIVFPI